MYKKPHVLRFTPSLFLAFLATITLGQFHGWAQEIGKLRVLKTGPHDGHYLQWNNKPILLVGDSVTQGWMELGSHFDYKGYVDALASRGMNLLMIWSYIGTNREHQKKDARIGYDAPEVWPWGGFPDRKNFDLMQFNPAYFTRLRNLVAYAEKKGVIVLITVHDGWPKRRFNMHPFNERLGNGPLLRPEQYVELDDYSTEMPLNFDPKWNWKKRNQYHQERFCDKLISELNPYSNVVYEMFNEGEWYDKSLRNQHEQHFLAFFRARCKNLLLSNSDHIRGDTPHTDPKLDVITVHGGWKRRFMDFQEGFYRTPVKPYFLSEPVPAFEGKNNTLLQLRRLLWEVTLAGGGLANQNDTSFGWDPRAAIAQLSQKRDLAYDYAGFCARFFNDSGVKFWKMKPNSRICSTGLCSAYKGMEYAIYMPRGGPLSVDLSNARGYFQLTWYNPRIGRFMKPEKTKASRYLDLTAPDFEDWVLHIKRIIDN